jgi:hypothetical protein
VTLQLIIVEAEFITTCRIYFPLFTFQPLTNVCNRGNAVLLAQTKQLAVFNLQTGLDIYGFPDFSRKYTVRYNIDTCTSQGIALFRSGALLASPTREGKINIYNSLDGTLVTTLYCPSSMVFSFLTFHRLRFPHFFQP